jgi:transcriptional activator of cad operon
MSQIQIGEWSVQPETGQISRQGEVARLEIRSVRVLAYLAERAGEVVSIEELLEKVWPDVAVSQDSVYQAVASLRRQLGDDPKQPKYIETVPRLGYRLVAQVGSATVREPTQENASPRSLSWKSAAWGAVAALCLGALGIYLFHIRPAKHNWQAADSVVQPTKSIAVLPFSDLTDEMNQEAFADGMTEQVIDKLSKMPEFQVPSATSSFYFKGKQIPVTDAAKTLGVSYVVDGNVRKSGKSLHVAARLIRVETGNVLWSQTYDRPMHDSEGYTTDGRFVLAVQDDIATKVAKTLSETPQNNRREEERAR